MAKYAGLPTDAALLSALLEGLQMSRQRLDAQIATVRAAIAGEPEAAAAPAAPDANAPKRRGRKPGSKNKKKAVPVAKVASATAVAAPAAAPAAKAGKAGRRKLSPAARKAIAAAQKRRWEEFRKNNPK